VSAYIHTRDGVTVFINGEQYHIDATEKIFEELTAALDNRADDKDLYEIINRRKNAVQQQLVLSDKLRYQDGCVYYKGEPLDNYGTERLIELFEEGYDVAPLVKFLERLANNPSQTVVNHLYKFLEHGRIPLTPEGKFLTYKAVRANYMDIHSGTFSNHIGASLRIERNKVDDNHNVTCSYGFHVCSFDYLPHFSHANGHVVICEVDPADVVAIPVDYNNTKMRVCAYRVVGEVEGYYEERRNILADAPVMGFGEYAIHGIYQDEGGESDVLQKFDRYKDAVSAAVELRDFGGDEYGNDWGGIVVKNHEGEVVFSA